ncbi:hypothetical protein ACFOW4_28040 [Micromonospora sp. GCM10011542]|uniref:hypothetical protein n=1 Tax=Micromonospora sp. GCM10011542 TaxID=3317337 RepID=UPI003608AEAD
MRAIRVVGATGLSGGGEMGAWGRVSVVAVVLLTGCTTTGGSADPVGAPVTTTTKGATATTAGATPAASAATGCGSRVETGPLPGWAAGGFSGDARAPHVFGAKGDIVAVLFAHPLARVRTDGSANKILWVPRPAATPSVTTSPDALAITATLDGTDTRVTREVSGGPGPSIIDLPTAGCWHLELRWSGRTDTMDLVYAESVPNRRRG